MEEEQARTLHVAFEASGVQSSVPLLIRSGDVKFAPFRDGQFYEKRHTINFAQEASQEERHAPLGVLYPHICAALIEHLNECKQIP